MSTPFPDYSASLRSQAPARDGRLRFFLQVRNDILAARDQIFLEYKNIEPSIGSHVALSLDEDGKIEGKSVSINYNSVTQVFTVDMPTSCYQNWIDYQFTEARVEGLFTADEYKSIETNSNTRFKTFADPYQMSFAVPNFYLKPRGSPLPTIVFVSGFPKVYPYLLMQKDVWLVGGAAHVNIVFIVKWAETAQSRIECRLEIWRKNQQGPEIVDIFPRPPLGAPLQEITIRRDELFGNAIHTGRQPSDVWRLSLELIRGTAEYNIREQGYVPA